ncbi:MAG: excinuclease ABC subunit UvrC [Firmicutes bacterium]|nr:excinuclease ABC subunit UvrC [Bacillota bacterium]
MGASASHETDPGLQEQLRQLPEQPGCYLFRDAAGEVIYVGKAVSLKSRVRSYFHSPSALSPKVAAMVPQIARIETVVTDSETEALALECNLIKHYRPRFNVRLRDDKNYPYLRVDLNAEWPTIRLVRSMRGDGARYFGPFTNSGAVRETLRTLRKVFPWRSCSDRRLAQGGPPCLYFHIHRCLAPCDGRVDRAAYHAMMEELVAFLEGRRGELIERLERRMFEAAEEERYEQAAVYRDQLAALRQVTERQKIVSQALEDADVIALGRGEHAVWAQVLYVREGKVVDEAAFDLTGVQGESDAEVLGAFVKQYYAQAAQIPPRLLLEQPIEEQEAVQAWLAERRRERSGSARLEIRVPRRGPKRELALMARKNAELLVRRDEEAWQRRRASAEGAVEELQRWLDLPRPPRRIECFDISSTQGREPVGSMVVFVDGRPARALYRRFRLQAGAGPDDYEAMREVVYRRLRRALAERDPKFLPLPDLLLVDGGKGQLGAALEAVRLAGADPGRLPVLAIAKEKEWLFAPGRSDPILLPADSAALHLVQRSRDEAHRFALAYHRRRRGRAALRSLLEEVPGIGPKRTRALLRAFPSLEAMEQAGEEALARVPGMSRAAARQLLEALRSRA